MDLLTRLFNRAKQKTVTFFSSTLGGGEDWFDALNLNTFKDSLYLFIGISMIRETVSGIPLEMHRIKNAQGDTEEVLHDPFLDLIERPNYLQTQKEFWKLAVAYYLLAGETFWYMERDGQKRLPTAMINMRPDHVEIVFSADKTQIVAYEFRQSNGTILKLAPEDVLHIKNIDPVNPARGIGVVRPATQRIITEKEAAKYQSDTFKNQGRPDIAVFTDGELTDETAEEARERWNKIYGGQSKKGAGFFGANVKDIKILNVSPKEMDGIQSMHFLRDDILAALRIPKQMIDTDVNYNNSRVAYATFVRQACEPVLDAFLDVINNKWLTDADEDKFLIYETEVGEDRDQLRQEAVETKRAGIISQNEARDLLGWPSVEGGDTFDTPAGNTFTLAMKQKRLRKIAVRQLKKRPVLLQKFAAVVAVKKMIDAEAHLAGVKRQRNPVFHTVEMKEAYIKAFNEKIDRKSNTFHDHLLVYNDGLVKRIIKHMDDFGVNPERIFDPVVEIPEARKVFEPLMERIYRKAGQDVMDDIAHGFSGKASEQFVTVEEVLKAIQRRAEFFIVSMLNTDFKELKKILTQGLADGIGVEEIGRNIRGYFDDMSVARARTIARTETGRLVSQATDEAYRQSAVVTGKEWLTAGDEKVRPEHRLNDGVIVATGAAFPNGEHYPGELTINCRCALAPAV